MWKKKKPQPYNRYEIDLTKIELDHSDPIHGLCMIIGKLYIDWIAFLAFEPKWWRWN